MAKNKRQKVKHYHRSFYSREMRVKRGIGIVVLVVAVLAAAWYAAPHVLDRATHTWYTVVKDRDLEAESASRAEAAASSAAASSAAASQAASEPEPEEEKPLDGKAITGGSWAELDVTTLTETGILRSAQLAYCADPSKFAQRLADAFPTFYFDSFLISSYPTPPKEVVTFTCRQLTGFGSSLETAVSDLKHYANIGMATVVLCQTQGRAKALADLLREQGVIAQLNLDLTELPQSGFATLAVGGLSSGMEYQGYAVITEGTALHSSQKKKAA